MWWKTVYIGVTVTALAVAMWLCVAVQSLQSDRAALEREVDRLEMRTRSLPEMLRTELRAHENSMKLWLEQRLARTK